ALLPGVDPHSYSTEQEMVMRTIIGWGVGATCATLIVTGLSAAPAPAQETKNDRGEVRQDSREIRGDRREIAKDTQEVPAIARIWTPRARSCGKPTSRVIRPPSRPRARTI